MTIIYPYQLHIFYQNDIEYQESLSDLIKNYTEWHKIIDILYDYMKHKNFTVIYNKMKIKHRLATSDKNCILLLMSYDYLIEFHKCLRALYTNNSVEFDINYNLLLNKIEII